MDGDGGPLSVVVEAANIHDCKLLRETLDAIVVWHPRMPEDEPANLCLDKGYDNPTSREVLEDTDYCPHVRRIGEESSSLADDPVRKARRWVVERTFAWLHKCRGILIRYNKKAENYLALIQLACALLWYRRLYRLTVSR